MCSCSQQGKGPESAPSRVEAKIPFSIFAKMRDFSCFGEISRNFVSQKFSFQISSERFQWLGNFCENHLSVVAKIHENNFNIWKIHKIFQCCPAHLLRSRTPIFAKTFTETNISAKICKISCHLFYTLLTSFAFFVIYRTRYLRKSQHMKIFAKNIFSFS